MYPTQNIDLFQWIVTSVKLFIFVYIATIVIKSTGLNNLFRKTNPSLARLVDIAARAVGTANLDLDPLQAPEPQFKKDDDIVANDPHDDYISDDDDDIMETQNIMLPQTLQFPDGALKKPEGINI
jgi:hypothetical protein